VTGLSPEREQSAAVCDEPGCTTGIARGPDHLCGGTPGRNDEFGCGRYFCVEHIDVVMEDGIERQCGRCTGMIDMPTVAPPEREQQIRARLSAATGRGQWILLAGRTVDEYRVKAIVGDDEVVVGAVDFGAGPAARDDKTFVVNAGRDIAVLLAEVDRLRAELAAVCNCYPDPGDHEDHCPIYHTAPPSSLPLCHCGHTERQHQDVGVGGTQCLICPGDDERSWRHPFTAAPATTEAGQ
jgi:hypothetical protein